MLQISGGTAYPRVQRPLHHWVQRLNINRCKKDVLILNGWYFWLHSLYFYVCMFKVIVSFVVGQGWGWWEPQLWKEADKQTQTHKWVEGWVDCIFCGAVWPVGKLMLVRWDDFSYIKPQFFKTFHDHWYNRDWAIFIKALQRCWNSSLQ